HRCVSGGVLDQPLPVASPVIYNSPVGGIGTATSRYGVIVIPITFDSSFALLLPSEDITLNSTWCGIFSAMFSLVSMAFNCCTVYVTERSFEIDSSCFDG